MRGARMLRSTLMYPQRTQEMEKCKHTPKYIIQLMNTLHGLKQAGGAWQKRVRAILEKTRLGSVDIGRLHQS